MENNATKIMSDKTDLELKKIIENRFDYQEEAYSAALYEIEKRRSGKVDTISVKEDVEHTVKEKEEVNNHKSFKELIEALLPDKNYYITPIIIYLNILIYIVMVLMGVDPFEPTVDSLIIWGGNLRDLTLAGQQWRLLTSVFLHGGLFHLLLNMYALIYIGKEIEIHIGNIRYLFAYLAAGVFASITSVTINYNIVSVGASGAIFGMYGLLISLLLFKAIELPKSTRKNFVISVFSFVGYNLLYGLTEEGIDNAAHIGGLVSGLVIGVIYYLSVKNSRLSKFVYWGISFLMLISIIVLPKAAPNMFTEFQVVMKEYAVNEEKAMWMYKEDLSYIPEDKIQYYYDRFRNEGIDLWSKNLELLNSLTDIDPALEERIKILKEYTNLRIQSCETMQELVRYNRQADEQKLIECNLKIESLVNELQSLSQ
nr:rhomboid family intramembrane serine protease [uncultured Carboxylicivirga sp.]